MPKIKVLLGTMPPWMRELLTYVIRSQTDMEVARAEASDPPGLVGEMQGQTFLIEAYPDPTRMPAAYVRIFNRYPEVAILTLPIDGGEGLLYKRRPTHRPVSTASVESILALIRGAGLDDELPPSEAAR